MPPCVVIAAPPSSPSPRPYLTPHSPLTLQGDALYDLSKVYQSLLGYDYILRQSRLRGRVDNNGVVSAFLEERLNAGFTLTFSAEIDHANKNHKFGFGMTVGE